MFYHESSSGLYKSEIGILEGFYEGSGRWGGGFQDIISALKGFRVEVLGCRSGVGVGEVVFVVVVLQVS